MGLTFNSAADNTPPEKTLAIQMPQAPSPKPSRLCYTVLPPLYNIAPFVRFCLKVHFSDKKEKKTRFSWFEPRTTDTRDARDATTAIGSVFFTTAALPHPALAVLLLLLKRGIIIRSGL